MLVLKYGSGDSDVIITMKRCRLALQTIVLQFDAISEWSLRVSAVRECVHEADGIGLHNHLNNFGERLRRVQTAWQDDCATTTTKRCGRR